MSCQEYFEKVWNIVEVKKSLGGSLSDEMHLNEEHHRGLQSILIKKSRKQKKGFTIKLWRMVF
jgi:hypothetical protein